MKKAIFILIILILSLLYYTGDASRRRKPFLSLKNSFRLKALLSTDRVWDLKKSTSPEPKRVGSTLPIEIG